MFAKVLIPTDLSRASFTAAERIGEVPGVREVILIHVRGSAASSPADEDTLQRMRGVVQRQGFPVEVMVAEDDGGGVPALILRTAAEMGVNLIAMGIRDQGLLRNLFSGNVAAAVLRDARVHILIMPQSAGIETPLFSRLLVPTDLADPAPEVRSLIEGATGDETAVFLHVVEPGRSGTEQETADRLAALKSEFAAAGREPEPLVRSGDPARTICAVANEIGASLVAIPRIGRRDAAGPAPLGSVTSAVAGCVRQPVLVLAVSIHLEIETRELRSDEFGLAEEIWIDYHELKADPAIDRIFGVFVNDELVSIARCRRHPDGYEVDGVFTPARFRGRGYARRSMDALVEACQHDTLYMHSVRNLVDFYGKYGFISIPESDLPPTIRARFAFALGEMEGANVQPMHRIAGRFRR
ncbi:MAG: GNAT family N-acetyltransferase [Methanoculleus sp.]